MHYSLHRFRFGVLPFAAVAVLASVISGGVRHVLAAGESQGSDKAVGISSAQIHETTIAEASGGSDVVAWHVTGTGPERHVAWVESDKTKTVWLDGEQVGGPYEEVKYFFFASRENHAILTVVARQESTWVLKVGAQEYRGFTKVTAPEIGPDGKVVAGVCRGNACRLLVDGEETGPTFENISAPDFSPKGTHLVYFGRRENVWVALVDGREVGPKMDDWWAHRWSPDERLAVAAELGGKFAWVVGGREGRRFDVIGNIAFSRDAQHVTYGGADASSGFRKKKVRGSIVVDEKPLEPSYEGRGMLGNWSWLGGTSESMVKGLRRLSPDFHGVSDPDFLPSGELVFGHRLPEGQIAVTFGEREGPPFDGLVSPILVSADGEHVAYVAKRGNELVEVRDQVPGRRFSAKRRTALVPWIAMTDEGHLVFATALGGGQFAAGATRRALRRVVIDGVPEAEYDALGISSCLFSLDGQRHAYVVVGAKGTRDRVLLNGRQTGLYDDIRNLHFLPAGVEFVARQGRRFLDVTIELR